MAAYNVTLFWFAQDAFVYDGSELMPIPLPDKGDTTAAIASFLAALDPKPGQVQLIYQPTGLDPLPTPCVRGSRHVVAKTLARSHPNIANPTSTWALLTPLPFEASYTSLLFLESKNRIPRLASALEDAGIALRGAWPLAALLDALPELSRPDSLAICLVSSDSAAAVYARQPEATRTFALFHDVGARASVPAQLNTCLSTFDSDNLPPVLVFHHGDPWHLPDDFTEFGAPTVAPLSALLDAADGLSIKAASNYLPPVTSIPWNRIVQFLAVCGLVAAAALGAMYWLDWRKLQEDALRRAAVADALRVEITHLNSNREQITTNLAFADSVTSDSSYVASLLETLVKSIPEEITLHSLTTTDSGFTVSGTVHEGLGLASGPYPKLLAALARPDAPWTLSAETPQKLEAPAFTISGRFNTSSKP